MKTMKRMIFYLLILAFLISCGQGTDDKVAVERDLLYVRVRPVERQDIRRTISVSGHTKPYQLHNIVPRQGGIIKEIYFEVGDRVKKGQLLVDLDRDTLIIQRKKADAQVNMAQSNFDIAKSNYERMTRLHNEKALSDSQLENAENAYNNAQASLKMANAYMEEVNQAIRDSQLYAPADGFIASRPFQPGDYVSSMMGNVPVLVLHEIDRLKIQLNVSKNHIGFVKNGQRVILEKLNKEGTVFSVGVSADPSSGSFPVEAMVDNQDNMLKPGITVSVSIVIDERNDAIAVPKEALYEQEYIYVVKDNIVSKRKVKLDFEGDSYYTVSNGINVSETVAVDNLYALQDNMRVMVD